MKFLILIALGIALNASFLFRSYAADPRNNNAKHCAELLTSFQDKMSRGLKKELHSARGNKKLTVFLLVPQSVAENVPLSGRFQQLGIELVRSYEPVEERTYLKVRGTKKSILILMEDFKTRETTLGASELEWAGLGKRTTQVVSEPARDRATTTTYPQASAELRDVLNSSQVKDSKVVEAAFYVSYDGVENIPSRQGKLDIISVRVQNVAVILKGLEAQGLVIKNKFEGLGMILVEAPMGLLRETLSQEINDVREVTPFDSNQKIELIRPVDVEMLRKYKAKLKPKLQNISGYTGIGIGDVNGEMGIRIYVKTEADIKSFEEVVKNFPVPVGFQVTGEIRALGANHHVILL